jgi:cyclopropane-fatty-acyl-phospholipid synthase
LWRILTHWDFELGQTYMEEAWDTGDASLRDLLTVLRSNFGTGGNHWRAHLLMQKVLGLINDIPRTYRNVARHYDVDEFVFRRFLDREMFYSCAYFREEDASLEQAQLDKATLIARKLLLAPGQKVLDIGSGWGSLAFHLAENHDVQVTGITLSHEQLRVAQAEAQRRNLQNQITFEVADYREHQGRYDRIVSVGMLEHVGVNNFPTYFSRARDLLTDTGVALIHSIGNQGRPKETNPWIKKYIFPGGRIPSLSELSRGVEAGRLMTTDVEVWRLHYARTLAHWYKRFQSHREEIRERMGEKFCRMWEFYLAASESAFVHADLTVFQFQLAKRHGSVPMTRDYLLRKE